MIFKFRDVRQNFGRLFEAERNPKFPKNDPKFSVTLMLDKTNPEHAKMAKDFMAVVDEVAAGRPFDNEAVIDGDAPGSHEANAGLYLVRASAAEDRRPHTVGKDKRPVVKADGVFYDGCRINATVDVYYSKQYKKVCAELLGVQFHADAESLGRRELGVDEMFDDDIPF